MTDIQVSVVTPVLIRPFRTNLLPLQDGRRRNFGKLFRYSPGGNSIRAPDGIAYNCNKFREFSAKSVRGFSRGINRNSEPAESMLAKMLKSVKREAPLLLTILELLSSGEQERSGSALKGQPFRDRMEHLINDTSSHRTSLFEVLGFSQSSGPSRVPVAVISVAEVFSVERFVSVRKFAGEPTPGRNVSFNPV